MKKRKGPYRGRHAWCGSQVVEQLAQVMTSAEATLPVVAALRNPAMAERHWLKVAVVLNCGSLPRDDTTTLRSLLALQVGLHILPPPALNK